MLQDKGDLYAFEGKKVWYRREGAGDPIVFLPNATLTAKLWDHQVEHFRSTHEVITVDLPGFGRSDRVRHPSLGLCLRWLDAFVSDLGLAPVALVGHCVGSTTALHYAARTPEKVSALVLIHTLTEEVNRASLKRYSDLPEDRSLRIPLRLYLRFMPRRHQRGFPYVRRQLGRNRTPEGKAYIEHARRCFADPSTRLAYFDLGRDAPNWVLPEWTKIARRPPLCWVWGDTNRLLQIDAARKQLDVLQPEEVHILEGIGYAAAWEAPDEVNQIIDAFLAGHTVRGRGARVPDAVGAR